MVALCPRLPSYLEFLSSPNDGKVTNQSKGGHPCQEVALLFLHYLRWCTEPLPIPLISGAHTGIYTKYRLPPVANQCQARWQMRLALVITYSSTNPGLASQLSNTRDARKHDS
jgi:hypothetical protein